MPQPLRTFIAVKINPDEALLRLRQELVDKLHGESVKWVDTKNMHLTIKFLGGTAIHQIEEINNALQEISYLFSPFVFKLKGLGFFKSKGMPRVLFVKPEDDQILHLLADEIDKRLDGFGYKRETRPFSTHLTLARIKWLKNKMNFYHAVEKNIDIDIQRVSVQEIIFYKSVLFPTGPEYIPLKKIQLINK